MDSTGKARQVFELVKPAIKELLEKYAKRQDLHIVFMNPQIKPWEAPFEEAILEEFFIGDPEKWEHDYKAIARSKAEQTWREQRANLITQTLGPATLRPNDTVYWGSFEYYGMVVACSGVESYFDMLVSSWLALAYQQLSQHYLTKFKTEYPNKGFLG
jgi:hypothetical protein